MPRTFPKETFPRFMFRADGSAQCFKTQEALTAAGPGWLELPPSMPVLSDEPEMEIDLTDLSETVDTVDIHPPADSERVNRAIQRRKPK